LNHKSIPRGIPSDSLSVDNALGVDSQQVVLGQAKSGDGWLGAGTAALLQLIVRDQSCRTGIERDVCASSHASTNFPYSVAT
jgi:hypothetical protein